MCCSLTLLKYRSDRVRRISFWIIVMIYKNINFPKPCKLASKFATTKVFMLLGYEIIKIKMLVIRIIIEMLLQALHKLEIHLYLLFLESTNNSNINFNFTMRYTLITVTCFPYWYTDRKWVCHFLSLIYINRIRMNETSSTLFHIHECTTEQSKYIYCPDCLITSNASKHH